VNSGNESGGTQPSAYRWIAALLFLGALHAWIFKNGADLAVFQLAGIRALRGEELYRLGEAMPFKYSPIAALLVSPFSLLPHKAAHLIWNALSALALLRLMRWSAPRASLGESLLVLALQALFIHRLFALGQIDALLLWLMVESEVRGIQRPLISGLLWAVACLFKPPFLVFLLAAAPNRQWTRIGALAGFTAVGLLAGWRELHAWRELLAATTAPMLCGDPENQGIVGIACHYFGHAEIAVPLAIAVAFVLLRRKRLAVAACFFFSAFFSPLCWETNLIALIPLAYVLARARVLWARAAAGLAAAANLLNYDLLGRDLFLRVLEYRPFALSSLVVALSAGLVDRPPEE
jgi:alpha-1,2-mannosyltransferase